MPRKAKEKTEELNTKKTNETTVSKKEIKSKSVDKKEDSKKIGITKKVTASSKTTTKKSSTSKKQPTSKESTSKSKSDKKVAKSTTKSTSKKVASKSTARKNDSSKIASIEYYDLPFRYNETVVKILAQTPNILFIYWDISDSDRKSYEEKFGNDFFEKTKPILVITNSTMNYTFEVEINDFANSWYLHINDAGCDYKVELGRRFIVNSDNANNYVSVASSNTLEAPNNHILFDKLGKNVFFRNVKTNFVQEKEISSLSYLQNMGRIYNIYDLYKEIYENELNESELDFNLSSSSSSTFM